MDAHLLCCYFNWNQLKTFIKILTISVTIRTTVIDVDVFFNRLLIGFLTSLRKGFFVVFNVVPPFSRRPA